MQPDWKPRPADEVAWENEVVLNVVQVLCGGISANMRAIAVEVDPNGRRAIVHFALRRNRESDREEIDDRISELYALFDQPLQVDISATVWVGRDWVRSDWVGREQRLVYSAKRRQLWRRS